VLGDFGGLDIIYRSMNHEIFSRYNTFPQQDDKVFRYVTSYYFKEY